MRLVFTGTGGKAGSWHMCGVQMAATRPDWKAIPKASLSDLAGADAVVMVKRIPKDTLDTIKKWGGPRIYQPLDFWRQPEDARNIGTPKEACIKFQKHFEEIDAEIVLTPNTMMKYDIAPICRRVEVLPHHYDPALHVDVHKEAKTLVYWGRTQYLAEWANPIRAACDKLGLEFLVNPAIPEHATMMVAVRGGIYGNWLDRRWKSSVKGATAMALGVPLVAWPEWSYTEFCGSVLWPFADQEQLYAAIQNAYSRRGEIAPSDKFSVENMAKRLEEILGV